MPSLGLKPPVMPSQTKPCIGWAMSKPYSVTSSMGWQKPYWQKAVRLGWPVKT